MFSISLLVGFYLVTLSSVTSYRVMYPRPITSVLEMNSFYTQVVESLGFVRVIKCDSLDWGTLRWVLGAPCGCACPDLVALHVLMQRHLQNKGIFYMFDENCSRQPQHLSLLLPVFDNPYTLYGITVANGPGNALDLSAADPKWFYEAHGGAKFNNKAATVLMFAHVRNSKAGYTRANVDEMKRAYMKNEKLPATVYVAFEVARMAHMEEDIDLAKEFSLATVVIYRDSESPFEEYMERLRKALLPFWMEEVGRVRYYITEEERILVFAYVPKVNWMQYKFKSQGNFNGQHMEDFQEFINGGRSQILVKATDCMAYDNEDFSATGLCKMDQNVYIYHLLTIADSRMTIGVQFKDGRQVALIDYTNLPRVPFIVLELVLGPNGDPTGVVALEHLNTGLPIHVVIGFVEQAGARKFYDQGDADRLMAVVQSDKFREANFGLRMRSDMLAHNYTTYYFEALLKNCTNFKWLFVTDAKNDPNLTDDAVRALKFNIKAFDRETFLLVEDPLRNRIYKNEDIEVTGPPSTAPPPPTLPPAPTTIFQTFTSPKETAPDRFTVFPTVTPLRDLKSGGEEIHSGGVQVLISVLLGVVMVAPLARWQAFIRNIGQP